jgi:NAD(P)-dependent dehydrogenase (short-subunit alcohol dehydrogenase family)
MVVSGRQASGADPGAALIIGAGPGLSASLARALHRRGHALILAARDTSDLGPLAAETAAVLVDCDARDPAAMERLFAAVDATGRALAVAIYNPSARSRGPVAELDPEDVRSALMVSAFGAFLMAHHAARRMIGTDGAGQGALLFTGASAGVKGFANSAPFAMGKFALRGLCQSLARELHPKGVHVGHFVIDGAIDAPGGNDPARLSPDAIAQSYLALIDQPRSAWSWEIELRPHLEKF